MDGNKTITVIAFAAIIALVATACKFQPPGYGGLYVDNLILASDTTDPGKTPPNMADFAITHIIDTSFVIEVALPSFLQPSEEIFKKSSDSVFQKEIEYLLKSTTDTDQLLRFPMVKLQKQLLAMSDTSFTEVTPQEVHPPDSLYTEVDFKEMIQAQNDTIIVLRKQLNELKNSGITKPDTVNVTSEIVKSPVTESQQTDNLTQQLLKAKDEQIQMLQNKLNALQNESAEPD